MQQFFHILKACPLFDGIGRTDLPALLGCLSARVKRFAKSAYVFSAGDPPEAVGIVLSGGVHIVREDFWGNRSLLTLAGEGDLFGEGFFYAGVEKLPVSVVAAHQCDILLLDPGRLAAPCGSACAFHGRLIRNMLGLLAGKNAVLTQKMEVVTQRTIRDKLLAYLSAQARQAGSAVFTIPFNRQELADYLSTDRSALSAELSRLRQEGLLAFHRSSFELLGETR